MSDRRSTPAINTATKIKVGDVAPDFSLLSQHGERVTLSEVLKTKIAVLYFYPKDNTRFCTTEGCKFRDAYSIFQDEGAEVLGISSDSVESHREFAATYNFPFYLLSDDKDRVRELYGVPRSIGFLLPGRVTYVIDRECIVRNIFASQIKVASHVEESLRIIRDLRAQGESGS